MNQSSVASESHVTRSGTVDMPATRYTRYHYRTAYTLFTINFHLSSMANSLTASIQCSECLTYTCCSPVTSSNTGENETREIYYEYYTKLLYIMINSKVIVDSIVRIRVGLLGESL